MRLFFCPINAAYKPTPTGHPRFRRNRAATSRNQGSRETPISPPLSAYSALRECQANITIKRDLLN
jgi:hypothetical protein